LNQGLAFTSLVLQGLSDSLASPGTFQTVEAHGRSREYFSIIPHLRNPSWEEATQNVVNEACEEKAENREPCD